MAQQRAICLYLTGYGQQTGLFVPRLNAAGHEIAVSAFYGVQGGILQWGDIRLYPQIAHPYGNDVIQAHANDWFEGQRGLILTLLDVWVLDSRALTRSDVACWTPVDHDPVPPNVLESLQLSQAVPIAMSRHGERMLRDGGLDPLYVPHGVDTNVYTPVEKADAKQALGFSPDMFVVGMVAANKGAPSRKGFTQALQAFKEFQAKHDDARLYLHTEPLGMFAGVNLPAMIQSLGIPGETVMFPDQYRTLVGFSQQHMRTVFSAMDVLLNPAGGEGFGVPILEAQACGTPVIVTDWTAMTEVGAVGWHVSGERFWTDQRSWWMFPSVEAIRWALGEAHSHAHRLGGKAVEHASQYDADLVTREFWLPALEEIGRRTGLAEEAKAAA
ncbi:MAG: glycosyltransferase [Gemmatimonadaceae bacterium]|nr:glycosyltransferase [Gemmatimonadaceae bacterium]